MLLSWLVACAGGPLDLSQVDDVRVVAMVAAPPEARPEELVSFATYVANPRHRTVEVAMWGCTNLGTGCAEAQTGPVADWAAVDTLGKGPVIADRQVPGQLDDLVGEYLSVFPARTWALACEEGLCPIVAELREAVDSGGSASPILANALADPSTWLGDLPFDGVSLATRTFYVSNANSSDRNHNPIYEARFVGFDDEVLHVDRGGEVELAFWVYDQDGDSVMAWCYTTVGRIEDRRERVSEGAVRFYLLADGGPGRGDVFVFFDDESGGGAVWSMPVEVD